MFSMRQMNKRQLGNHSYITKAHLGGEGRVRKWQFLLTFSVLIRGVTKFSMYQGCVKSKVAGVFEDLKFKRAIFQTFWKVHCCAKFLFFELETLNFGYLLFFLSFL